jgi:glucose/arabinose dehydrogenase
MSIAYLRNHIMAPFLRFTPLFLHLAFALLFAQTQTTSGTALPSGFGEIQYAKGLLSPTAMAFAPDPCPASGPPVHRLFVCEQGGRIRVFRNGVLQPKAFLFVSCDTRGERGLDGICFDPNFATNHYVYIYYTIKPADTSLPTHNRVSRFTADPANPDVALAGSEKRILDLPNLGLTSYVHNGSAIHFGPDGKLYISVGENNQPASALQSLNTVFGKILRINPVPENPDGTVPASAIPTDNPFYNTATGINRAIYLLGLRNPFTFAFQRGTGRMFINDVGASTWEEINDGKKGANYGWPTYEGPIKPPAAGFTSPIFAYMHFSGTPQGCAITGGDFYNPPPLCSGEPQFGFPSSYVGKYFFLDLCTRFIYTMDPTQIDPASPYGFYEVSPFATGITHSSLTYLIVGPDRNLYYISRDDGAVYQIRYPASLAPTIGTQPADVLVGQGWPSTFSVDASGAPTLHYRWQRNNTDISGAADAPSYTVTNPQVSTDNGATFSCIVSNSFGSATTRNAVLSVTTKQPPIPTISSPPPSFYYNWGDTLSFAGSAVDGVDAVTHQPQDGVLAPSALTWQILAEHHPVTSPNHHTHPFFPPTSGIAGGTLTLNFTETDPDVWYRIFLTAVDSYGLSQTIFRDIFPRHAQLSVTTSPVTSPVPLKVKIDGSPKNVPAKFWSVVNLPRTLGVDTPQTVNGATYDFVSWSDGGARIHNVSTPATATSYIANFAKRVATNASVTTTSSISAKPNPFTPNSQGLGQTTLTWTSSGITKVEIHVDAPNGNMFTSSGPGTFSATTGQWVQNGQTFYLQNVSNGLPLTAANTLARVTLTALSTTPKGSISASPNPFTPNSQGLGQTTITWTSAGTTKVEIHVDAPNGNMLTNSGPGTFSATTAQWVQNGQTFYLQNVSNGLPLTSANTLAKVTMTASP